MKVLMIGPSLKGQGGITSVVNIYKDYGVFKKNRVKYISTFVDYNFCFKIFYFLFSLLRIMLNLFNREIKIVHIHSSSKFSFYRKSIIILLSKLFNKKIILHIHSGAFDSFYYANRKTIKTYIKYIISLTDKVIVLSDEWDKKLKHLLENKSKLLYNPVILPKLIDSSSRNSINVLFLGRLGKRKGTYDLINACKLLRNKSYTLLLCGDGEINKVKELVKLNNLENNIKILGWISGKQKEDLLQNSDILVLPSYNEGLPISILEAMAYQLPVISTNVGGIPEAVIDGKTGFVIKPGDVKELAKKLDLLISNKNLRLKMGKEGRKLAEQKFDVDKIAKQLQSIYESLAK